MLRRHALSLATFPLLLSACSSPAIFRRSYTGLFGTLHLIALIWMIIDITGSDRKSTGTKVLWILVVAFFPLLGLIFYIIAGREK